VVGLTPAVRGVTPAVRVTVNPLAGPAPVWSPYTRDPLEFHRRLPGYRVTPLLDTPPLAGRLGVGRVLVKCESARFGLPAFKMLGASWATYRALSEHLGGDLGPWRTLDELAERLRPAQPLALAAATDGNHGRAVAHMARLLGLGARIFVPSGTTPARMAAIEQEGAALTVVAGDYDAAVARSAQEAGPRCLVISDTSWPGYDRVPRWVAEGYSTLFWEIDDALAASGLAPPDLVVVPVGVGALAAATVNHYRRVAGPALLGVEPADADCLRASVLAGQPTVVPGPHHSIMAGLNCGTPSAVAWPLVAAGVDVFTAVDDEWAKQAVRELAALGIEAGETGAAALAGLSAVHALGPPPGLGRPMGPGATVLVLCTEGATDPASYRRIVGVELVGEPSAK